MSLLQAVESVCEYVGKPLAQEATQLVFCVVCGFGASRLTVMLVTRSAETRPKFASNVAFC